jgi:hypothetical protein
MVVPIARLEGSDAMNRNRSVEDVGGRALRIW